MAAVGGMIEIRVCPRVNNIGALSKTIYASAVRPTDLRLLSEGNICEDRTDDECGERQ